MEKISKKEVEKDVRRAKDLEVLASSNGGKLLQTALRKDVASTISSLSYKYQEVSHAELIALCADLRSQFAMLKLLKNARTNSKFMQEQLDELLKEEGEFEDNDS